MRAKLTFLIYFLTIFFLFLNACEPERTEQGLADREATSYNRRRITDMRGVEVSVPEKVQRVVAISDGFIAGALSCLGEIDKIVGLGSRCVQSHFSYEYTSVEGERYRYDNGMNPVTFLQPRLMDLPLVAASNLALNYETLAGLRPDVVILRAGSCTFGTLDDENTQKTIRTIEAIGIPLIVLKGPPCFDQPTLEFISEEIHLLGRLFHKEEKARQLAMYLEEEARQIRKRTRNIPDDAKRRLLLLGLSPRVRASGSAGNTKGKDTIESYFIESFAGAQNAYEGLGGRAGYAVLSAEQIYALDPDVILLPTSSGYHPTRELYSAPYFKNLQVLRAVKDRRVYALPWTPCNCAKRIEYPIEMMIMAKAAYPERFADLKVYEWVLTFYQRVYGVDEAVARELRSVQWLDWMEEEGF